MTGEFPSQKASNAENVFILWHHHAQSPSQQLYNYVHGLCFLVVWNGKFYPYSSGLLHWQLGNHNIICEAKLDEYALYFCGYLYETPLEWGYWWVIHDDVIKWKHFLHNWPFVWRIHHSPVNSPHKGQWCGALIFSLICVWMNDWVNNREAGDLRCYCAHYDVIVMLSQVKLGDRITYLCQIIINYLYITLCWDGLISKLVCIVLCKV